MPGNSPGMLEADHTAERKTGLIPLTLGEAATAARRERRSEREAPKRGSGHSRNRSIERFAPCHCAPHAIRPQLSCVTMSRSREWMRRRPVLLSEINRYRPRQSWRRIYRSGFRAKRR